MSIYSYFLLKRFHTFCCINTLRPSDQWWHIGPICVRELGYHWPQLCLVTSATIVVPAESMMTYCQLESKCSPFRRRHFEMHFLEWNYIWISINISLKFVSRGQISDIPTLVHIMAWRRPGDKPLSEPMKFSLLTRICVPWPQWVTHVIRPILNESLHIVLQNNNSFINPFWVTLYHYLKKSLSVHKLLLKMNSLRKAFVWQPDFSTVHQWSILIKALEEAQEFSYLELFTILFSASRSIPSCFMKRKTWKWIGGYGFGGLEVQRDTRVTSQWARWCLKSPASWLLTQQCVKAHIKESTNTGVCAGGGGGGGGGGGVLMITRDVSRVILTS